MIKVLIVDDHPVVCRAISAALKATPALKIIGEAQDGKAAVQIAKELHPHVVLLDLNLPKINGLKAASLILKQDPNVKVIAFTSFEGHYVIHAALREGFNGYLTKTSPIEEIAKAIKKVYSGENYFQNEIAEKITDKAFPLNKLSEREYEIFNLLVKNNNPKDIASSLKINLSTFRTHEKNVYKKLKIKSNKELIFFAMKAGFFELN